VVGKKDRKVVVFRQHCVFRSPASICHSRKVVMNPARRNRMLGRDVGLRCACLSSGTTTIQKNGDMSKYTLNVNGKAQAVDVEADTPLLWALRDTLGLVGTKYGCGMGVCGACTVHVDGQPARSCQLPVAAVGKRKVTTIEGLDANAGHPLQQAWVELDVPQCGYCQAGQIMTACALLKQHPRPTDAQIDEAMAGNLCRCATYVRIRAGIHRAAEIAAAGGNKR
jgi:isoquinoline 1-oxidoreductase subunit alpha